MVFAELPWESGGNLGRIRSISQLHWSKTRPILGRMTPFWLSCFWSSCFSGRPSDMVLPRRVPTGRRPVGRRAQRARTRGANRPSRCSSFDGCSSKDSWGGAGCSSPSATGPTPGRQRPIYIYMRMRRRNRPGAGGGGRRRSHCRCSSRLGRPEWRSEAAPLGGGERPAQPCRLARPCAPPRQPLRTAGCDAARGGLRPRRPRPSPWCGASPKRPR